MRRSVGQQILTQPRPYVTDQKSKLVSALKRLWELMTPDINWEIDEYTETHDNFFDYKNLFKNSTFTKSMTGLIIKDYTKAIRKDSTNEFVKIFASIA